MGESRCWGRVSKPKTCTFRQSEKRIMPNADMSHINMGLGREKISIHIFV